MAVLTKEGDSGPHIHHEHGKGLKHGLPAKQGDSNGLEPRKVMADLISIMSKGTALGMASRPNKVMATA
jgi:hypothetical protein